MIRHSPVNTRKLLPFCLMILFLFSACAVTDVKVDLPTEMPVVKSTVFGDILPRLGKMSEIYLDSKVNIQATPIRDDTGISEENYDAKELPHDITEIVKSSLNAIGGNVVYIPYDPSYIQNSKVTGYSDFSGKVKPHVIITGGITEFDRNLEFREKGKDMGVTSPQITGLPDWVPSDTISIQNRQSQRESMSSITLDFNLVDFETLTGISKTQAVNSMKIYKGANDKEFGITLLGPTFGFNSAMTRVQGTHAAIRLLVELSTIQIVGKYLKLPYWRLLPDASPDPAVMDAVQTDFYQMSQEEQIAAIQRLLYLHNHDVSITGQLDQDTRNALKKLGPQAGVDSSTYMYLYNSVPIDTFRHLALKNSVQKIAAQKKISTKPIADVSAVETSPITATKTAPVPQTQKQLAHQESQAPSSKATAPAQEDIPYASVVSMLTKLGKNSAPSGFDMWTDRQQFSIGDSIKYYFQTGKDCYVVVVDITTDGKVIQLFPNRYHSEAVVYAGKTYVIVDDRADMSLEVTGPAGREVVIAFVSEHPFELFPTDFSNQPFVELSKNPDRLKTVSSRIQCAEKLNVSQKWIQYKIIGK